MKPDTIFRAFDGKDSGYVPPKKLAISPKLKLHRKAKDEIDPKEALRKLPPLIKGYVRAGCFIGDGAVVDKQFGTTDVLIYFPVSHIDQRWSSKLNRAG